MNFLCARQQCRSHKGCSKENNHIEGIATSVKHLLFDLTAGRSKHIMYT